MACDAGPEVCRHAPSHFRRDRWVVAIGGEIAGIVLLRQHKFDHGNLALLIGLLVGIAIFAIAGNLMWKAANKHDPARKSDPARFFFQNQLGAIITVIAFLPLIVLIFMDKDMDPKNKKIAGGSRRRPGGGRDADRGRLQPAVGRAIYPGHEQVRGRRSKPISRPRLVHPRSPSRPRPSPRIPATVAEATKDAAHPNGLDVVYWIAPENGAKKAATPHVFHICQGVSPLRGKTVNHGSVTQAYAENATRITKQIPMEQKQCGFAGATPDKAATPPAG